MDIVSIIIGFVAGAVIALAAYILLRKSMLKGKRDEILEKAEIEGEKIKNERILQAKEKYLSLKAEHEKTVNEKNAQIRDAENRVRQKENTLNQKLSEADRKSKDLEAQIGAAKAREEAMQEKEKEYEELRGQVIRQIETIAGLSAQEAKNQLMESMKAEARTEAQAYINDCPPRPPSRMQLLPSLSRTTKSRAVSLAVKAVTSAPSRPQPVWRLWWTTPRTQSFSAPLTLCDVRLPVWPCISWW